MAAYFLHFCCDISSFTKQLLNQCLMQQKVIAYCKRTWKIMYLDFFMKNILCPVVSEDNKFFSCNEFIVFCLTIRGASYSGATENRAAPQLC